MKKRDVRNALSEMEQNIKLTISEVTENESAFLVCNNNFQLLSLEPEQRGV